MARIVVDPVTRIEGHLRIEAQVDGGVITDAWSSGTMFRGIELILRGRDPREAWIWAQRICGVCTMVHALASVNAVEDALGIEVPDNARLIRNIIAATQTIQDHVIHFYHLHALGLGGCGLVLEGGPGEDGAVGAIDLRLAQVEREVFQGRSGPRQRLGCEQATESFWRRLLGTPRLPSST
jgi:hypothetical protein